MAENTPQQQSKPSWTFISVALVVIGLIILLPSGLCTAVFGFFTIVESFSQNVDLSSVLMVLLFGGLPMLVGWVLVWARLRARARD